MGRDISKGIQLITQTTTPPSHACLRTREDRGRHSWFPLSCCLKSKRGLSFFLKSFCFRCIPFRYRSLSDDCDMSGKIVEVLMINSTSGPGLLFPKGGSENDETVEEAAVREAMEEPGVRGDLKGDDLIGNYDFKSKTHQDEFCPDGSCKAAVFALFDTKELEDWPEQDVRERTWLTILEAIKSCCYSWMRDALENGFLKWHGDNMVDDE